MIYKKALKVATIIVCVATLSVAGYIMYNRLGLVDELDFGAGAYYYADIPEFDKLEPKDAFVTKVPMWIHILLFLVWGVLMYLLWIWIDRRKS